MDLEKIVADLVQKVERRYFGKYRGFVVDNAVHERVTIGRVHLRHRDACEQWIVGTERGGARAVGGNR